VKLGLFLINFDDAIIKTCRIYFGSNSRKNAKNPKNYLFFTYNFVFIDIDSKIFSQFKIRLALIDLKGIFLMKPSELEISNSIDRYDEKNYRKLVKL